MQQQPKFSQRHYDVLTEALAKERTPARRRGQMQTWVNVMRTIKTRLKDDNPKFDARKFEEDCRL